MSTVARAFLRTAAVIAIAGASPAAPAAASPAGQQYVVSIANMAYGAMPSGAKVGDSILFVNKDSVPHTVTARDHSFDLRIGPGQRGRLNVTKAGTYQIYCSIHPAMRATLKVGG